MKKFNIADFGAQPGILCTGKIQAAFDAASAKCGTVVIPSGTYITGTINMGQASLYLEKGAVLKSSGDLSDYKETGYDHNEFGKRVRSLLYTMDAQDITISGEGTIDLNGWSFYDINKRTVPPSESPLTDTQIEECTAEIGDRPEQPIFFVHCSGVSVKDIRITQAPCWTISFIECTDVRVADVTVDNDLRIPNNDGMHFCGCRGVSIRGCHIVSGDDCIALSSISDWNRPCEDITISDCVLETSSKSIAVGYMHSIVRNVTITNCTIRNSHRGFLIMSSTGGLVENVTVSNLTIDTHIHAGNWWGNGEAVCIMGTYHNSEHYRDQEPVREKHACIRNILIRNITCSTENALAVVGENYSVENVLIDGLTVRLKDSPNMNVKGHVVDISPAPNTMHVPDNTWAYLNGVRRVRIQNALVDDFHGVHPGVYTENCEDVRVSEI